MLPCPIRPQPRNAVLPAEGWANLKPLANEETKFDSFCPYHLSFPAVCVVLLKMSDNAIAVEAPLVDVDLPPASPQSKR